VKLSKIKLLLICLSLGLGHYVFAQTPNAAKDIRVGDQPWSVPTTQGPITAFQSLNVDSRFYIAPEFRFIAVNTKGDVAKTGISHADKSSILMNLQLMIPAVNAEVTQYLSKQIGQTVSVGHLAVYAIVVDLMEEFFQQKYGLENAYKIEQPTFTKALPVTFLVDRAKADEFIRDVNSGKVTFRLTYAFNQINIDSHYAELSARLIRDTDQIRHLDQQGKELMTAEQMAEVTTKIRNQITSKEILSLGGKIEPRSIPIEKLMVLFEVGDLMKKTEAQLADFERRLYKQLNLNVDPKDFQPFRVQKHVIESMNSSKDVAEQRQNYSRDYNREKKKFSASVSASAKWGPFSGSASSHYAREAEKVTDRRAMSDEAFRDFVTKSHGVEYDTEERLFRGVKIYDTQKIKALGDLKVVSVTVKPTLTSGVKRLDLVPKSPIYGEAAITVSREGNVGIGTTNPDTLAKLYVNGPIMGIRWYDYRAYIRFMREDGITDGNLCPEGGKPTIVTGPDQSLKWGTGNEICANSWHSEKTCINVHSIAPCGTINGNHYPYDPQSCHENLSGKWAPYFWHSDATTHNVTTHALGQGIGCQLVKYACCK